MAGGKNYHEILIFLSLIEIICFSNPTQVVPSELDGNLHVLQYFFIPLKAITLQLSYIEPVEKSV